MFRRVDAVQIHPIMHVYFSAERLRHLQRGKIKFRTARRISTSAAGARRRPPHWRIQRDRVAAILVLLARPPHRASLTRVPIGLAAAPRNQPSVLTLVRIQPSRAADALRRRQGNPQHDLRLRHADALLLHPKPKFNDALFHALWDARLLKGNFLCHDA